MFDSSLVQFCRYFLIGQGQLYTIYVYFKNIRWFTILARLLLCAFFFLNMFPLRPPSSFSVHLPAVHPWSSVSLPVCSPVSLCSAHPDYSWHLDQSPLSLATDKLISFCLGCQCEAGQSAFILFIYFLTGITGRPLRAQATGNCPAAPFGQLRRPVSCAGVSCAVVSCATVFCYCFLYWCLLSPVLLVSFCCLHCCCLFLLSPALLSFLLLFPVLLSPVCHMLCPCRILKEQDLRFGSLWLSVWVNHLANSWSSM